MDDTGTITAANQGTEPQETVIRGIGVSAGLVIGTAYRVTLPEADANAVDRTIREDDIPAELMRLAAALDKSKEQILQIKSEVVDKIGDDNAVLFDSYLMILDDDALTERIEETMRRSLVGVEAATRIASKAFSDELLKDMQDDYIRARAKDIRDIGERIVSNLLGIEADLDLHALPKGCILVVDDLTPSETAHLDASRIGAFVTRGGSRTSHTAILSRALGIPAVVGIQDGVNGIETGMELALDGEAGVIHLRPGLVTRREFERRQRQEAELQSQLMAESNHPVETLDGYQACLVANVELPSEALNVRKRYNVGIGLFRTEFLFINGMNLRDEEQQFAAYRETVESVMPFSVIFRTLDIGGDKFLKQFSMPHELNPFMGMRAIRLSLSQQDIFKVQLRAILRASAFGKVRVMFPMISTYEELDHALKILDEVKLELKRAGVPFNDALDVGCMIEVPAAALLAERLVKRLTFFSLGTNDLVQYSMAVDRSNSSIGYLYQPAHPSIVRMMKHVVDVAYAHDRWVSICGEMAGECLYAPLILGLGIHELSMSPVALAQVSKVIRSIRMYEAEQLVNSALECERHEDVIRLCKDLLRRACPDMLRETPKG